MVYFKIKSLPLLIFTFVLASCKTIKTEAPISDRDPVINVSAQKTSTISIPIKIDLSKYFEETNKAVPVNFSGADNACEGVSVAYTFKRDPIYFYGRDESLLFDVDGSYSIKLNYCPQCTELFSDEGSCIIPRMYASCGIGEELPRLHVSFGTKIGVSNNYNLVSKTKLRFVQALSPCKVTVFNYNATKRVETEVEKALKPVEKEIDNEISSISLKNELQETWDLLKEPIDLEGYGFFNINPESIAINDIRYKGKYAEFNAIIGAKPTVELRKPEIEKEVIPNLEKKNIPPGMEISMDIHATYDSLSNMISRELNGVKTEIKGKEIIFGNVQFDDYNEKLSIAIEFSGNKKGILYLVGTPTIDTTNQIMSLPDLEFDIKTKNVLLKSAKWIFDKKITNLIRKYAIIDMKPYLLDIKKEIDWSINGELTNGVFMAGKMNHVSVENIIPLQEELLIRGLGKGELKIDM